MDQTNNEWAWWAAGAGAVGSILLKLLASMRRWSLGKDRAQVSEFDKVAERYNQLLARMDTEISALHARIRNLEAENAEYARKNLKLEYEILQIKLQLNARLPNTLTPTLPPDSEL